MDSSWAALFAILLTTFLLLLKKVVGHRGRRRLNLPPGPKPWPIIGNLNLMGPLPHRTLQALSKKHGPLMYLRFGSCPVVVGSSVDMAKVFLKTQDLNFVSRPKLSVVKHSTYNYTDITWAPYGPYWRQARKICWTELFSAKRLASFQYIRAEEVSFLIRDLFKESSSVVGLGDYLSNMGLNIISRVVLGKKYAEESSGSTSVVTPEEFKWMAEELFAVSGAINIGDSIPWLDFLDLHGYMKRIMKVTGMFDRFLGHVIDEHNERRLREGGSFAAKDMVDVLLHLADDPFIEIKMDKNNIKAFIMDLLVAGTESSAVGIEWAISEILRNPRVIDVATEELDRVVGNERWVEEDDIEKLPYIEAIVKETMRLHPLAPLLVPHMSREDCTVEGYDIPAGTRVLVSAWSIGRDPSVWEAAEEFRPERFIGNTIDVKGNHFELLPFSAGRRMCPGYLLALKISQLSIANLLHGFKWGLPGSMRPEELDMEEKFGLSTPRKVPLEVMVEPRLPPHLYSA